MVNSSKFCSFSNFISLDSIKLDPYLQDMMVIKRGARLSIQPISQENYNYISQLGG